MPKKYGVKEKDLVVSHVVTLILTGKLRSGDRIDRNEIADELGLSRVPVQEAMVQLEHDGIVSTRYHRGAFVERFDESTVTEHHQIYGILNGIAATRAARAADPELLERLEVMLRQLRTLSDPMAFQMLTWEYRTAINDAYAGPRLQALIRSSYSFVPACCGAPTARCATTFWPSTRPKPRRSAPATRMRSGSSTSRAPDAWPRSWSPNCAAAASSEICASTEHKR